MVVFVLDKHKKPLMPCSEKRARLLLERGRAVIDRIVPFTIRLNDRTIEDSQLQPLRLKIEPGAKISGLALLEETDPPKAIWFGELRHKTMIKKSLDDRRMYRRRRRSKNLRYRKPRFDNRIRPKGWMPPSLIARVQQTMNIVNKLRKIAPIAALSIEHAKFDAQKMENPEISGVEYQQGTLWGYVIREYLLLKWGHRCAYCGIQNVPLEIDHITPKSRDGVDRVDNLTIACHNCNQQKDNQTAEEFGHPEIQAQANKPLKDVAMVSATRWRIYEELKEMGLSIEAGTGGRTKMQRTQHGLPKTHYYDALCVGASTSDNIEIQSKFVKKIAAKGRGKRQRRDHDKYGFPRKRKDGTEVKAKMKQKMINGFMHGDFVKTDEGIKGRIISLREKGNFTIKGHEGSFSKTWRKLTLIQRGDGWEYGKELIIPPNVVEVEG